MAESTESTDIRMQGDKLYREETFTDRGSGTIARLTPVCLDGTTDESRDVLYVGQAQLMTGAGPLPLSFELEADSLHEAVEQFGPAANKAADEMVERLKEMQREQSSSIVTPGSDPSSAGGGSKLHMP